MKSVSINTYIGSNSVFFPDIRSDIYPNLIFQGSPLLRSPREPWTPIL